VGHHFKKQREKPASPRSLEALLTPGAPGNIVGSFEDLRVAIKLIA
jgi:hypothetical protein